MTTRNDASPLKLEEWYTHLHFSDQTRRQYSFFLLASNLFIWSILFLFTKRLPLARVNKFLLYYMQVFSINISILHIVRIALIKPSAQTWNLLGGFVFLLCTLRLATVTTRLHMFRRFSTCVLFSWFAVLMVLQACIIFPEFADLAYVSPSVVHLVAKLLFILMILVMNRNFCSGKLNAVRFFMCLTILLPSGVVDYIAEFELWFALSTFFGFVVLRKDLYKNSLVSQQKTTLAVMRDHLDGRNDRHRPLLLDKLAPERPRRKVRNVKRGRLSIVKSRRKPGLVREVVKEKVEIKKSRLDEPRRSIAQESITVAPEPPIDLVKAEQRPATAFTPPPPDEYLITRSPSMLDMDSSPNARHLSSHMVDHGIRCTNSSPESRSPASLLDSFHAGSSGDYYNSIAPASNPQPLPTQHPTSGIIPTHQPVSDILPAHHAQQSIPPNSYGLPPHSRRRERSFSDPSLSDSREGLCPRRRTAQNRRQLVIRMIDEIILGNEALIESDQHTDVYERFLHSKVHPNLDPVPV